MEFMTIEKQGPVAVMIWNHEAQNRFITPFMLEIISELDNLAKDDSVTAVVITSRNEKFFTSGLFLEWMMGKTQEDISHLREFLEAIHQILLTVTAFPKPLVAAINGHAVGAGVVLPACMDFRLMRKEYGFVRLPEVQIGIAFWPGMTAILRDIMPDSSFRKMTYTGDKFNADQAKELGFVDEVVAGEFLEARAVELAQKLGNGMLPTYKAIKRGNRAAALKVMKEQDPLAIEASMKQFGGQG